MKILLSAILTGIVAIWLTITFYQNQQLNYSVNEASLNCDKAKFDLAFAKRENDKEAIELARLDVKKFCEDRDRKVEARDEKESKSGEELDQMKDTLKQEIYKSENK